MAKSRNSRARKNHSVAKQRKNIQVIERLVPVLDENGKQKLMPDVLSKLSDNPEKAAKQKQYIVHKRGYPIMRLERHVIKHNAL